MAVQAASSAQREDAMSTQRSPTTRRSVLTMGAAAATSVAALSARAAAQSNGPMYKIVSVLARKPDQTVEEFVKHWEEVHAPLVESVPGVVRYTLSIVKGSSTRTDGVGALELPADGFAELWFEDMASLLTLLSHTLSMASCNESCNGTEVSVSTSYHSTS